MSGLPPLTLLLLATVIVVGCQGTGITTGPGSVPDSWTFRTGAPASESPGSDALGPPAALLGASGAGGAAAVPAGSPQQGRYVGVANVTSNPLDLECASTQPINDFEVHGNSVSMGGFQGRIGPDGSLTLQAGPRYIFGRFVGSQFVGTLNNSPGCSYSFSLHPA